MIDSARDAALADPDARILPLARRWLAPLGPAGRMARRGAQRLVREAVRWTFRLRVEGDPSLAALRPIVLSPNHGSSLDGLLVAAALPPAVLAQTRVVAWRRAVAGRLVQRWASRLLGVVPAERDDSALAAGAAVLQRGLHLLWFPEGTRTRTGELQEFAPGIGWLMDRLRIPAVPVWIEGAWKAFPPGARWPRLGARITVRFGDVLNPASVPGSHGDERAAFLVEELRRRVASLGDRSEPPPS